MRSFRVASGTSCPLKPYGPRADLVCMAERLKRTASVAILMVLSVLRRLSRRRNMVGGREVAVRRRSWSLRGAIFAAAMLLVSTGFASRLHRSPGLPLGLPPGITEVHGYSGDVGTPPDHGKWRAVGTTLSTAGYSNDARGKRIIRALIIDRVCDGRSCYFWLWLEVAGEPGASARLVREADGWRATFPVRRYTCRQTPTGSWIYWPQQTTMIFRFPPGGRTLEARQRDYSWAADCGYGTSESEWTGVRVGRQTLLSSPTTWRRERPVFKSR